MKARIVINDNIIQDALSGSRTVTDVLAQTYAGDIQDRIKDNESLRGLDAFQFAMIDAGITKHSTIKDMYQTDDNRWLFPVWVDRRLREGVSAMNILPYLLGGTETVSSTSIQGAKLIMDDANKDATKLKRVAEGTDLPLAILKLADTAYTLKKRGRALQASYETYMFQTLDMFGKHMDMIANDVSGQQVGDVIKVMVEGDGNSNPAPVETIEGANGLTSEELAIFAIKFWRRSNLPLTGLLTGDGEFYRKLMLTTFNVNEVNGMIAGATFNFPQAMLRELTVVYDNRVPLASAKEQLIGLNKDYAVTKYLAAGSQIREVDKNIRNQTNLGTISEIAGFGKFNDNATVILRAK